VVLVIEEIARACGITGRIVVEGNLGVVGALRSYGTDAQKRRYFPWVLDGEKPAIAITEVEAGSAATDLATRADETPTGYRITGHKRYITGAGTSRLYLVYARFGDRPGAEGIGGVLVERDTPGFRAGKKEDKLGMRASETSEVIFENCRVPVSQMLGAEGQGFINALQVLDAGRIGIAALSVGLAQGAYEAARSYAFVRKQFGQPIGTFQSIRAKLVDTATRIEAARLLTYRAAAMKDQGQRTTLEAAMAKLYSSEIAVRAAEDGVQVHGGYGFVKDYPAEKYFRDVKLTTIGEGTSEIQRLVIARQLLAD
jgi:alkylation response protein AidB-like acyl-CoA dehydrogenase